MSIAKGLKHLGFTPLVDFVLRDENGTTVFEEWNSNKPQPSTAEIEAAHAEWKDAYDNDYARKRREAYNAAGCTIEALAIATFESVFADDSAAAVKLQIEREKIKAAIPK